MPSQSKPKSERQILRRCAVAFALLYIGVATSFAALNAGTPLPGTITWPEVFCGPAITIGCSYLLFYAGVRLECWIRGPDEPLTAADPARREPGIGHFERKG
jgi:hypothetical protein